MTNSEAIELLNALTTQYRINDKQYCQLEKIDGYDFDALNLAIKALEENAKLCEENKHIRQTHVSHKVYIDLLKKYVDVLEENEKLKNKYDNLDAKFTNMMTDYENKITKIKIEIARLKEKEVAINQKVIDRTIERLKENKVIGADCVGIGFECIPLFKAMEIVKEESKNQ